MVQHCIPLSFFDPLSLFLKEYFSDTQMLFVTIGPSSCTTPGATVFLQQLQAVHTGHIKATIANTFVLHVRSSAVYCQGFVILHPV